MRHEDNAWSGEESLYLLRLRADDQPWSRIARVLHRTQASCRNRLRRVRLVQMGGRNLCARCGQLRRGHMCLLPEERPYDDPSLFSGAQPDLSGAQPDTQPDVSHSSCELAYLLDLCISEQLPLEWMRRVVR